MWRGGQTGGTLAHSSDCNCSVISLQFSQSNSPQSRLWHTFSPSESECEFSKGQRIRVCSKCEWHRSHRSELYMYNHSTLNHPLPAICNYWADTLESHLSLFVFYRAIACEDQSPFGRPDEERAWSSATEQAAPPSCRPHVQSHVFVTKLFESRCTLPLGEEEQEQRRSVNQKRKSNEREGAVVSRKLDVLQPTELWNLKHPTNTELLNSAKDTLPQKKQKKRNHPVTAEALFLLQTLIEAVYSQAVRTPCVHYIVKIQTVS